MNRNKAVLTLVGFILAGLGFMALVLSVVGAKLSFLVWIDYAGAFWGFVIRLLMILVGIIIIYLAQTDFEGKNPM